MSAATEKIWRICNNNVKLCQAILSLAVDIFKQRIWKIFFLQSTTELIMTKADLKAVPDVDIDEGVFKYVYIRYVSLCYF